MTIQGPLEAEQCGLSSFNGIAVFIYRSYFCIGVGICSSCHVLSGIGYRLPVTGWMDEYIQFLI